MARPKKAVETIMDVPPEPVSAWDLPEPQATPPEAPETPERIPAVVPEASPCHALDSAPVNSKVVVTLDGALLATPDGVSALPKSDPANRLPVGAKIRKTAPGEYLSDQLNAGHALPERIYSNTLEAIRNFVDDFHPKGLYN